MMNSFYTLSYDQQEEIKKLYILFKHCLPSLNKDGQDYIHRAYILEKIERLLHKMPIVLDSKNSKYYEKEFNYIEIQKNGGK